MDFQRVAIFGPGLLGGSLALAMARRPGAAAIPPGIRVWGRRAEPLDQLHQREPSVEVFTDLAEAAAGADLLILATPVGAMRDCVGRLKEAGAIAPGAVITDVGSVKAPVVAELEPLAAEAGASFVGSHPMAGSEKTGMEHASANLFHGAACLVTPTPASDAAAVARVESLWRWLGGRVSLLGPREHDEAMGLISHLPHLVAAILADCVLGQAPALGQIAGGGFRDTTRVASGPPEMWMEILMENSGAVRQALARFHARTGETLAFFERLDHGGLRRLLENAKAARDALRPPGSPETSSQT